jgi:hypothetical protein
MRRSPAAPVSLKTPTGRLLLGLVERDLFRKPVSTFRDRAIQIKDHRK